MRHIFLGLCFLVLACSTSGKKNINDNPGKKSDSAKILIVYLSRTNNTKMIAEIIQHNVGGTLIALELKNPYPKDYRTTVQQVAKENETGYLPPLKTKIDSIQKYDIIFVGFPTWGMRLPPPMKSFLKQYDLSGKIIVPFNTNDGYGVGSSFESVKELCPDSKIMDGFTTKGGIDKEGKALLTKDESIKAAAIAINHWLQKIKVIKEPVKSE